MVNVSYSTIIIPKPDTGVESGAARFGSRKFKVYARSAFTATNEAATQASNHEESHNTLPNILSRKSVKEIDTSRQNSVLEAVNEMRSPAFKKKRNSEMLSPQLVRYNVKSPIAKNELP